MARYYRTDQARNQSVSTEITGYAVSTLVYLHWLTGDTRYLERAVVAARFLTRTAWDATRRAMPFEIGQDSYFFDCGIIARGLLAVWRATGDREFLDGAVEVANSMASDFNANGTGDYHPVLALPEKHARERDAARWSRSAGCYQLKAAMAWSDLAEATGNSQWHAPYERVLAYSLRGYGRFLPGHPERFKVMDRLHAFVYFLEGLLPRVRDKACAAALCAGIDSVAGYLREIAPAFERSDVYAQLLRIRLYADWAKIKPLDADAAQFEAERLASFQVSDADPRLDGGFRFGRQGETWLPYVNPVSTAFALQALALWHSRTPEPHHVLI